MQSCHIFQWLSLSYCSQCSSKKLHSFSQHCGFDMNQFVIDLYYWFDKSSKRKMDYARIATFVIKNITIEKNMFQHSGSV